MSHEDEARGVTFAVPTASVGTYAPTPNSDEPVADERDEFVSEPPLYAVVIHEGREVFYKRVGA